VIVMDVRFPSRASLVKSMTAEERNFDVVLYGTY
jgi:hypothetical protein